MKDAAFEALMAYSSAPLRAFDQAVDREIHGGPVGEQVRKAVAARGLPFAFGIPVAAVEGDVVADAFVRLVLPNCHLAAVDADFVDGAFFGFGGCFRVLVRHVQFPFLLRPA